MNKAYKKKSLIIKVLKKGAPNFKSLEIVTCKKQSKSSSRLSLVGKLEIAKIATNPYHILRLDKRRLCRLIAAKKITLRAEILKYLIPECYLSIEKINSNKFK
jgi:hypothetical protein